MAVEQTPPDLGEFQDAYERMRSARGDLLDDGAGEATDERVFAYVRQLDKIGHALGDIDVADRATIEGLGFYVDNFEGNLYAMIDRNHVRLDLAGRISPAMDAYLRLAQLGIEDPVYEVYLCLPSAGIAERAMMWEAFERAYPSFQEPEGLKSMPTRSAEYISLFVGAYTGEDKTQNIDHETKKLNQDMQDALRTFADTYPDSSYTGIVQDAWEIWTKAGFRQSDAVLEQLRELFDQAEPRGE